MAIAAKVGALAAKTSTGTQDYTGFGFQPEAMLFPSMFYGATAGTVADYRAIFVADALSSLKRRASGRSTDALATSRALIAQAQAGWHITLNAGSDAASAYCSEWLADGVKLQFSTTDGTAHRIPYLALDGVSAYVGTITAPTTVRSVSVTAPNFRPELLLCYTSALVTGDDYAFGDVLFSLGIANGRQQACQWNAVKHASGVSITGRGARTDKLVWIVNPAGTDQYVATLESFDATGFTVAFSTVTGTAHVINYIALKGASGALRSYIGGFSQPTSTGTQAIGIDGCNPVAYMVGGVGAADSLTSTTEARWMLGASDGTSQWAHWAGDQHGADTTVSDTALSEAKVALLYTEGTPSLVTDAAHSAMTSGSVTLDWTTVDATAREQLLIALGNDAAGYYPWPATLLFKGYAPSQEFTYYTPQTSTPTAATVQTATGTPTVTRQLAALVTAAALTFTGAAPTVTARQAAHPTSDVAAGTWTPSTGSDLYAMVDEADTPDDNDYITSGVDPVDDTAVLGLGALGIPTTGTVTIRLRHKLVT